MKSVMKIIRKFTLSLICADILLLISCSSQNFHVVGTISNAADSTLYFENMALDGIHVVDSVKLPTDGKFSFGGKPSDSPEFYRLRIGSQIINISVDSTETITINARFPDMSTSYTVKGSDNCDKIQALSLLQYQLQADVMRVVDDASLGIKATEDSIMALIDVYKKNVTYNYIYREPMKAYAYFALFQYIMIGNTYIMLYDPQRFPEDVKVFAAVATNWDANFPNALRTENLHNIALERMRDKRIVERSQGGLVIDADKFDEVNLIDIVLSDNKGQLKRLTDLKGKVVLLDFHQFGTSTSMERIMFLRDIYNKYHDKGLEIYQVAVGTEKHFWKTQTASLPWICVYDIDGRASNAYLAPAQQIPCDYLIDRNNIVVRGASEMQDIESQINSVI